MSAQGNLEEQFRTFSTYSVEPKKAVEMLAQARSECPVPHSEELGGFHIFLNDVDVRKALGDFRTFASSPSVLRPYVEGSPTLLPISLDPPEHNVWRKIITDGVNARAAERISGALRGTIVECIEGFAGRGECDLVPEMTEILPMRAIFFVLGFEKSLHKMVRELTLRTLGSVANPKEFEANFKEFTAFSFKQIELRRANPQDDFLTVLAQSKIDDEYLKPADIGAILTGLLIAGNGTTVSTMTSMFYEVFSRPELKDELINNPDRIPDAVEESLRLNCPVFGLYRRTTEPVERYGKTIPANDTVYLCYQAANRDPAVYRDPDTFDINRERNQHLAFGFGRHSCPGAPIARMDMRLALEEILKRLPDIELAEPDAVAAHFEGAETVMIPSLKVRFTPR